MLCFRTQSQRHSASVSLPLYTVLTVLVVTICDTIDSMHLTQSLLSYSVFQVPTAALSPHTSSITSSLASTGTDHRRRLGTAQDRQSSAVLSRLRSGGEESTRASPHRLAHSAMDATLHHAPRGPYYNTHHHSNDSSSLSGNTARKDPACRVRSLLPCTPSILCRSTGLSPLRSSHPCNQSEEVGG